MTKTKLLNLFDSRETRIKEIFQYTIIERI